MKEEQIDKTLDAIGSLIKAAVTVIDCFKSFQKKKENA